MKKKFLISSALIILTALILPPAAPTRNYTNNDDVAYAVTEEPQTASGVIVTKTVSITEFKAPASETATEDALTTSQGTETTVPTTTANTSATRSTNTQSTNTTVPKTTTVATTNEPVTEKSKPTATEAIPETQNDDNIEWIDFNCSAYCTCPSCIIGKGLTASGTKPKANWTIAASRDYPFGTLIYIDGYGTYCVEDRGGAITGNKLDIYFGTHSGACNFGRRQLKGYVVRWGYDDKKK